MTAASVWAASSRRARYSSTRNSLKLNFAVTDTIQSYPVIHTGAPPELFKEGTGVVIEGHFDGQAFYGDNVLVKHSEQYEPVQAGVPIDVEELKETLQ